MTSSSLLSIGDSGLTTPSSHVDQDITLYDHAGYMYIYTQYVIHVYMCVYCFVLYIICILVIKVFEES